MTRRQATRAAAILAAAAMSLLLAPVPSPAQAPAPSFDLLNTRLKPGDTVWVTDAQGREIKGRIATLAPSSLTLGDGQAARTLQVDDVRGVRMRQRDSLVNGTLLGLGAGAGFGLALGLMFDSMSEEYDPWSGTAETMPLSGATGAGVGALVDALMPGRKRDVYRAPAAGAPVRFSLAPMLSRQARDVRLAISF